MDKVIKTFRGTIKAVDTKNNTVDAVVSDESIDRHDEVILMSAWTKGLKEYKKHAPLLVDHRYTIESQIGTAEKVWVEEDKLVARFKYFVGDGNTSADWAFKLAEKEVAAFSVGFMSKSATYDTEEIKELLGNKKKLPWKVYKEVELYEISQVVIPANAAALQKSIDTEDVDPVVKEISEYVLKSLSENLEGVSDEGEEEDPMGGAPNAKSVEEGVSDEGASEEDKNTEAKPNVAYRKCLLSDKEDVWDAEVAEANIKVWSTKGDQINWARYKKGFTCYDTKNCEISGSYKALHHDVIDDELQTNWKGLVDAMTLYLTGGAGVDISEADRKKGYLHLARHYKDFGVDAPEYKSYHTPEDIVAGCKDVNTAMTLMLFLQDTEKQEKEDKLADALLGLETLNTGIKTIFDDFREGIKEDLNTCFKSIFAMDTEEKEIAEEDAEEKLEDAKIEKGKTYMANILDEIEGITKSLK